MHRRLLRAALGLLPIALPLACGSLNKGDVVILDEGGGSPNNGGSTSGSAGRGGSSTAGGNAGKAGGGTGGGASGDAGEAGMGTSASGGSSNGGQGGSSGNGGAGGTSGNAGTGGGGGEPGECTQSPECGASKPICDDGTCRACAAPTGMDADECAEFGATPHCDASSGHCVECAGSRDCSDVKPVCDANACRTCRAGSECETGACTVKGRCADEASIVYVSDGGTNDPTSCGTRAKPCVNPSIAAGLLNSDTRPFMVILYTSRGFDTSFSLPAGSNVAVFGNGVTLYSQDVPVLQISGGSVLLDDIVFQTNGSVPGAMGPSAVSCNGANLKVIRTWISNSSAADSSVGLSLTDCTADIRQSNLSHNKNALISRSTSPIPGQSLTVERSLFESNVEAIDFNGASFTIRNNLFTGNGLVNNIAIISLAAQAPSIFSYNTLYGNDNACSAVNGAAGGLVYCATAGAGCGTHSGNLFWGNMFNFATGVPCPDQVYALSMLPTSIDYTIAEYDWDLGYSTDPGSGTVLSTDPRLSDPANGDFTPSSSSSAIDRGDVDPAVMPDVDYYGNPRPVGNGPDIGAIEVQ